MSKGEPVLSPQWLKDNGSYNGGGTNRSGFFLRSDDQSGSIHGRNKSSVRSSDHVSSQSSILDRTNSAYLRRSSSSKDSAKSKSYGSFNRSHRDREWEDSHDFWDRDRTLQGERRHREYPDNFGNKDVLPHSQSMISRKPNRSLDSRVGGDSSNASNSNHSNTNGKLHSASNVPNSTLATFGQGFPSLVAEHGQGSDLSRASSPGFNGLVLPFSSVSSSTVSQDELNSAQAENQELIGSASTGSLSSQLTVAATFAPLAQRVNGLNMAEAVAQGPSHARTPPQLTVDTQRLQELAIKQSRQLIPMTPTMPRPLSPSPVEKPKLKPGQQQQQQSQLLPNHHHTNQNIRGGASRPDVGKASTLGKLQVLKSSRGLNGISSTLKDGSSPKNGVISPLLQTPAATSALNKNPFSNQNPAAANGRKPSMASTNLEKRTSLQIQSRNDFFNLIKKKSSASPHSGIWTSNDDSVGEATSLSENGAKITPNGECRGDGEEKHSDFYAPPPDEKEAAFLRILGWEECSGEDEGLTEEEINAFYESIKARPASELKGIRFLRLNNGAEF